MFLVERNLNRYTEIYVCSAFIRFHSQCNVLSQKIRWKDDNLVSMIITELAEK